MCCSTSMCYTCLKKDCKELVNLYHTDFDEVTYIEKLKLCVRNELQDSGAKEICRLCVKQLRITYEFLKTLSVSQESLRRYIEELQESLKIETEVEHEDKSSAQACDGVREVFDEIKKQSCTEKDYLLDDLTIITNKTNEEHNGCNKCGKPPLDVKNKCESCVKSTEIYTCNYCEQVFVKRWQLQKHVRRIHLAEKKFSCKYCGKAFKQSYHLSEHMTCHSRGEKKYQCTFCDKKFHRISSQRRHIRSHEAVPGQKTKRTPFLCSVCGKSFPFSNSVQRHMRVHLGIKKHECSVCQRKFNQSTHLQVHMRTHTGEKPYICHSCGEAFALNSSLQKHLRVHHECKTDDIKNGYKFA